MSVAQIDTEGKGPRLIDQRDDGRTQDARSDRSGAAKEWFLSDEVMTVRSGELTVGCH